MLPFCVQAGQAALFCQSASFSMHIHLCPAMLTLHCKRMYAVRPCSTCLVWGYAMLYAGSCVGCRMFACARVMHTDLAQAMLDVHLQSWFTQHFELFGLVFCRTSCCFGCAALRLRHVPQDNVPWGSVCKSVQCGAVSCLIIYLNLNESERRPAGSHNGTAAQVQLPQDASGYWVALMRNTGCHICLSETSEITTPKHGRNTWCMALVVYCASCIVCGE